MLSLTSELLFYTRDCLKISLKNSYNLPENNYNFCHLPIKHQNQKRMRRAFSRLFVNGTHVSSSNLRAALCYSPF